MNQGDDDLDCLRRMQQGDERALAELYDRYTPLLHSLALRIVRSAPDAEEVVQQVWVQAWKESARHDPQRGSVAAWLVMVTRSRALDASRSQASRRRGEERVEAEPIIPPDDPRAVAQRKQVGDRVRAALALLDPKQREAVEIAYFEGLSQSEVAERLGAPLGTIKSWTRSALTRLREVLPAEDFA